MSEQEALIKATQRVADLFWGMASDESGSVSWYRSTFYAGAKDLLIKSIEATYPGVDVDKVFDILIESGESVAYSVEYWTKYDKLHEWCKIEYVDDPANMAYCYTHGTSFTY